MRKVGRCDVNLGYLGVGDDDDDAYNYDYESHLKTEINRSNANFEFIWIQNPDECIVGKKSKAWLNRFYAELQSC